MARLARIVAAGLPHHVTQRGNRRQRNPLNPENCFVFP
jgi:REP-associated tyrosine transposase